MSVDIGQHPTANNMLYSASKVIITAAAYKIPVIGYCGPFGFIDGKFSDRFLEVLNFSRELGFQGAYATHPSQIPHINSVFNMSDVSRKKLEGIVATTRKNAVFSYDGMLIGPPMIKRFNKMLGN